MNFVCGPLNKNVHSFLLGAHSKILDIMLKSSLLVEISSLTPEFLTDVSYRKDIVSGSKSCSQTRTLVLECCSISTVSITLVTR